MACGLVAAGCADDEGPAGTTAPGSHEPCRSAPWDCPAGETCWVNYERTGFVCQASGVGVSGASCVNGYGAPTCADGLGCYQLRGQAQGVCSPFCDPVDPDHACPPELTCRPVLYRLSSTDVVLHLCATAGAGGAGAAGGGSVGQGGEGGEAG